MADKPQEKKNDYNSFTTLITHCKFQPLVFNTFWENDFSTFQIVVQMCRWTDDGRQVITIASYLKIIKDEDNRNNVWRRLENPGISNNTGEKGG